MKKKIFISFLFLLFSFSLISAAIEVQLNAPADQGVDIVYPSYKVAKLNAAFELIIHAFNRSNGLLLTDETTNCTLHLLGSNGSEIFKNNFSFYNNVYLINISSSTFSNTGIYSYIIHCNNSEAGGFVSDNFKVTPTGSASPTQGEGIIFTSSLLAMTLFSVFFLILSFQFKPNKDAQQNEDGSYNPIPNDKPALRFGFLALSFIIGFIVLLYAMVSMQNVFYGFDKIIDSYYIFMWIMGFIFILIFIFVLITLLIQAVDSLRSGRGLKNV